MDNLERAKNENPSRLEQIEYDGKRPTVIENILNGQAKIEFLSESMETRGRYQGTTYCYGLTVPHLTKPNEKWVTTLSVWFPAAFYPLFDERMNRKPEMQIDILTGQGEMALSRNPETLRKVYDEMRRQADHAKKENPSE